MTSQTAERQCLSDDCLSVISNSPSQDYTHPDDRTLLYEDKDIIKISKKIRELHHPLILTSSIK